MRARVKRLSSREWRHEKREAMPRNASKDCYVSWDTLGSYILAAITTQTNILTLQTTTKNFSTKLYTHSPMLFSPTYSHLPLQPQCCDVSLWIIPLTEGRSNAAAAAKHRTAPALRLSRGSRARWSRHLCSPRDPTELGSHIYGLILPPSPQTLDQHELWLPPRNTANETVLPRVDKPA